MALWRKLWRKLWRVLGATPSYPGYRVFRYATCLVPGSEDVMPTELWQVRGTRVAIRSAPSTSGRVVGTKGPGEVFLTEASGAAPVWVRLAAAELEAMRATVANAYCCVDGKTVGRGELGRLIERTTDLRWSYEASTSRAAEAGGAWRSDLKAEKQHLMFRPLVSTAASPLPWLRAWCPDPARGAETEGLTRINGVLDERKPAASVRVWACAYVSSALSRVTLARRVRGFAAHHAPLCDKVVVFLDCAVGRDALRLLPDLPENLVVHRCFDAAWWTTELRFNRIQAAAGRGGAEERDVCERAAKGDTSARRQLAFDRVERSDDVDWLLKLDVHDRLHLPREDCCTFFGAARANALDLCALDAVPSCPGAYMLHSALVDDAEAMRELVLVPIYKRRLAALPRLEEADEEELVAVAHAPLATRTAVRVGRDASRPVLQTSLFAPVVVSLKNLLAPKEWVALLKDSSDVFARIADRCDSVKLYNALFSNEYDEVAHAAQFGLVVRVPVVDDDDVADIVTISPPPPRAPVSTNRDSTALVSYTPASAQDVPSDPGFARPPPPRYNLDRIDAIADAAPAAPPSFSHFVQHRRHALVSSSEDDDDDDIDADNESDDGGAGATAREPVALSSSFAAFMRQRKEDPGFVSSAAEDAKSPSRRRPPPPFRKRRPERRGPPTLTEREDSHGTTA